MTDPVSAHHNDEHAPEEQHTDTIGRDTVTFDCKYCDTILETTTVTAMKDRGTRHLKTHKPTLLAVFTDKTRGKDCRNNCDYRFPGGDDVTGFECPNCGYDNFESFASRYLYWQIEYS